MISSEGIDSRTPACGKNNNNILNKQVFAT
jgi:hypothetical protein